jgi:low affinity Fe/Cu permease
MKHNKQPVSGLNQLFLNIADWVSEAMGRPLNILFWFAAVMTWTLLFALDKHLASGSFLPSWFTSQGYNFPLNLITTVAELFIGFLVAAATNRAQAALTNLLTHIKVAIDKTEKLENTMRQLILDNTRLTQEVHDLISNTKEVKP